MSKTKKRIEIDIFAPKKHELTKRICLQCDREFDSYGRQNRVCKRCKKYQHNVGVVPYIYGHKDLRED